MLGDCYEASFNYVVGALPAFSPVNVLLCHGIVVGTMGPLEGKSFGHAWVEFSDVRQDLVLEIANGKRDLVPKAAYYKHGHVSDVVRYDETQARIEALRHGHFGPWAPVFEGVL